MGASAHALRSAGSTPEGTRDGGKAAGDVGEARECMCGYLTLRESDQGQIAERVRQAAGRDRDLKPVAGLHSGPRRLQRSGAALQKGWDAVDNRGRLAPAET
ncbi:hypothetical protein NDU88_001236 [Pleurodeles waltl]|uniref:Uncharacterized protein n=1 Tax=Pleurodeles waltl TaxID=8319 RepID=A0AAV7U5T2_PLEWA|nr:hypothetical protein NDU88_001236 [Pleurodeles waltl]